jgi:hypothetical protein
MLYFNLSHNFNECMYNLQYMSVCPSFTFCVLEINAKSRFIYIIFSFEGGKFEIFDNVVVICIFRAQILLFILFTHNKSIWTGTETNS